MINKRLMQKRLLIFNFRLQLSPYLLFLTSLNYLLKEMKNKLKEHFKYKRLLVLLKQQLIQLKRLQRYLQRLQILHLRKVYESPMLWQLEWLVLLKLPLLHRNNFKAEVAEGEQIFNRLKVEAQRKRHNLT